MSSRAVDRQEKGALKSSACVLLARGVSGGVVVGVLGAVDRGVLVNGVSVGPRITSKSSSGSLKMLLIYRKTFCPSTPSVALNSARGAVAQLVV